MPCEQRFQTRLRPWPRGRKRRTDALHEQLWPLDQAVNSAGLHQMTLESLALTDAQIVNRNTSRPAPTAPAQGVRCSVR